MSGFKPYFSDQNEWDKHINQSKKRSSTKPFYTFKKTQNNIEDPEIKLITPMAQSVEQAESELKRKYAELLQYHHPHEHINKAVKKPRYQSVKRNRKNK